MSNLLSACSPTFAGNERDGQSRHGSLGMTIRNSGSNWWSDVAKTAHHLDGARHVPPICERNVLKSASATGSTTQLHRLRDAEKGLDGAMARLDMSLRAAEMGAIGRFGTTEPRTSPFKTEAGKSELCLSSGQRRRSAASSPPRSPPATPASASKITPKTSTAAIETPPKAVKVCRVNSDYCMYSSNPSERWHARTPKTVDRASVSAKSLGESWHLPQAERRRHSTTPNFQDCTDNKKAIDSRWKSALAELGTETRGYSSEAASPQTDDWHVHSLTDDVHFPMGAASGPIPSVPSMMPRFATIRSCRHHDFADVTDAIHPQPTLPSASRLEASTSASSPSSGVDEEGELTRARTSNYKCPSVIRSAVSACDVQSKSVAAAGDDLRELIEAASEAARVCPKVAPLAETLNTVAVGELARLRHAQASNGGGADETHKMAAELREAAREGLKLLRSALKESGTSPGSPVAPNSKERPPPKFIASPPFGLPSPTDASSKQQSLSERKLPRFNKVPSAPILLGDGKATPDPRRFSPEVCVCQAPHVPTSREAGPRPELRRIFGSVAQDMQGAICRIRSARRRMCADNFPRSPGSPPTFACSPPR